MPPTAPPASKPSLETQAVLAGRLFDAIGESLVDIDEQYVVDIGAELARQTAIDPKGTYRGDRGWIQNFRRLVDERADVQARTAFVTQLRDGVPCPVFPAERSGEKARALVQGFLTARGSEGPQMLVDFGKLVVAIREKSIGEQETQLERYAAAIAGTAYVLGVSGNPLSRAELEQRALQAVEQIESLRADVQAIQPAADRFPSAWARHVGPVASQLTKRAVAAWSSNLAGAAEASDDDDEVLKDLREQLAVAESRVTETAATLESAGSASGDAVSVLRASMIDPILKRAEARHAELAARRIEIARNTIDALAPALGRAGTDVTSWAQIIKADEAGAGLPADTRSSLVAAATAAFLEDATAWGVVLDAI